MVDRDILGCKITNWQLAENNFRTSLVQSFQFVEDDLPFCVDDRLVLRYLVDPDFCVVLLALELQLHVERHDLWILEALGLLFKSGIGEGLLERDTVNKERILQAAAGDLFDPDQLLVQIILIKGQDSIDNH